MAVPIYIPIVLLTIIFHIVLTAILTKGFNKGKGVYLVSPILLLISFIVLLILSLNAKEFAVLAYVPLTILNGIILFVVSIINLYLYLLQLNKQNLKR